MEARDYRSDQQTARGNVMGDTLGRSLTRDDFIKGGAIKIAEPATQSEVERELRKLLDTAEELDAVVGKLVGRIEKATRTEPAMPTAGEPAVAACPGTMLGRDLDGLNRRIRGSMAILLSTIQRIEL